jgi:hypothetical protein
MGRCFRFVCFHPVPMQGLYKVFLYKAKRPNILSLRKLAVVVNSIAEVRLMKDCMYRDIMILDMENITVNDIAKITPPLIAEIFTIYAVLYIAPRPNYNNLFFMCAESVLASFGSNLSPQRAFVRLATDGNAQIGIEAQDFQQSE